MKNAAKKQRLAPATGADDDALELAMSRLEEGTVVKVYRYRDDGGAEFVTQLAPQPNLDFEIARTCGPGKYQLKFYGKRTAERPAGFRGSATIHVGAAAVPLIPEPTVPERPTDRIGALLEGGVVNVFKAMTDASEMNARMLERAITPRPDSRVDRLLEIALPLVLPALVDRLLRREAPDELARARELAELVTKSQRPQSSLSDVRDLLALARELQELTPAPAPEAAPVTGAGDPVWLRMLERVGVQLAERFMTRPADAGAPAAALPAAAVPEEEAEEAVEVGPGMPDELQMIRPLLAPLVAWAREGKPPRDVASALRVLIDPEYHPRVLTVLQRGNVVAALATYVPALRPHAAWLEEVRAETVRALAGQAPPASGGPEGTGGGTGAGNAGSGRARKARGSQTEP